MNKLLTFVCLLLLFSSRAQINPFESIGKRGEVLTLSNGKYTEVFDNDSLQRIGSVIVNMNTGTIYALLDEDILYSESTLDPTIIIRWWSPDPLASSLPSWSPYATFNNNPIYYVDSEGKFSIQVIKRDDGSMELKIVTTGFVKGKLAEKIINDFHDSYPNGYADQGEYVDDNGVKWTITVQIEMRDYSEYDGKGSIVDSDCLPPTGEAENAPQNGFEVCAGAAGLALHGLWHNTGGDDCYSGEGYICARTGLLDDPSIKTSDFYQIGYKLIDEVPENLNGAANTKKQSVTDFVQSKGDGFMLNSEAAPQFGWDDSYPNGIDKLVEVQNQRMNSLNSPENDPGRPASTENQGKSKYESGTTRRGSFIKSGEQ